MYKIILFVFALALFAAATSVSNVSFEKKGPVSTLGVVDPTRRCGGLATQLQLRISDCDGHCMLIPGTVYNCENDFMPSMAAPSLTLKIEICMSAGFCLQILSTELPNSSVQPGFMYTAKYSIVPNDILAGETIEFRAYILHTDDAHIDVCIAADVDIQG